MYLLLIGVHVTVLLTDRRRHFYALYVHYDKVELQHVNRPSMNLGRNVSWCIRTQRCLGKNVQKILMICVDPDVLRSS